MDKSLDESIQAKARELANSITVAHDLDPEIQEELYGHIEDKLLAYIDGEEPVMPEDALILVKEHFGDAAVVKGMFQDVHREVVERSLFRRLLVAAITTLVCVQGVAWLAHFADVIFDSSNPKPFPNRYVMQGVCAIAYLLPWLCFVRWKRRMKRGERVWFSRWSTGRLGIAFLGLLGVSRIMPGVWGILDGVLLDPAVLHQLLTQTIRSGGWHDHRYILVAAFLVVNVVLFSMIVAGGMRFRSAGRGRRMQGAFPWLFVACL
ncbi:MAG: hypothetical protein L3K26_06055, partial [Candidatus Hydrogenedentes bacterium]|nr:hypothetical protein [Candidatus Hydrogenedentota bacterium]